LKFPKEKQIPHLTLCKTTHKKIENPPNDKKKIEDSRISKYKNKKFQNSNEERHIPHFLTCETSQNFF
jgi:hypothetical protein